MFQRITETQVLGKERGGQEINNKTLLMKIIFYDMHNISSPSSRKEILKIFSGKKINISDLRLFMYKAHPNYTIICFPLIYFSEVYNAQL